MPQQPEGKTDQPNSLVPAFRAFLPENPAWNQEAALTDLKIAELTPWHSPVRRANHILKILADFRDSLPEDVRKREDFTRTYNGAVSVLNDSLKRK